MDVATALTLVKDMDVASALTLVKDMDVATALTLVKDMDVATALTSIISSISSKFLIFRILKRMGIARTRFSSNHRLSL